MRRFLLGALVLGLVALGVSGTAHGANAGRFTTWVARYNDDQNDLDVGRSVAISPDGSTVYVAGSAHNCFGDCQYATMAYDASSGVQKWAAFYDGGGPSFCGEDQAEKVVVSPDGSRVYVTGESCWPTTGYLGYATVAYDAASGGQLWVARFGRPAVPADMVINSDGTRLFVTGWIAGDRAGYATVAYDTSNGRRLWVASFAGSYTYPYALGLTPDGAKVFVTGVTNSDGDYRYATVAYNAVNGKQLWDSEYGGSNTSNIDTALALTVAPDGSRLFVTGQSGFPFDYVTIAYDATTGGLDWLSTYDNGITDVARAIGLSPDGSRVYVTGESDDSNGQPDYATVSYDEASGAQLWVSRYDGPKGGTDTAAALVVGPGGTLIYVTGTSAGRTSGPDYATIAYNAATGTRSWLLRYNGPASGEDDAADVGVSPDGSAVFITGSSDGGSTSADIATQARIS